MQFLFKRYLVGLAKRRRWLALAAIPPLVLLLWMWLQPDRFTIRQELQIPGDPPLAAFQSPTEVITLSELIQHPPLLFQDSFAVAELGRQLQAMNPVALSHSAQAALAYTLRQSLSLKRTGENGVGIEYYGEDQELGDILVGFFAHRFLKRAEDGWTRAGRPGKPAVQLAGTLHRESHRVPWRPDRLPVVVKTALFSVLSVLLLIGLSEWSDRSFKSERQVARYLDAHVIGSFPNVEKLASKMSERFSC